ncbi:hypothetical protein HDU89_007355 [Geranomyces variabilis]|nr:hypothetical protein HDU89_007355 [Geranomyces variabilis]
MGQALPKQTTTFKQPQQQHALSSSSSAPSPPSLFAAFSLSHTRPALATTEIPSVLSAADTQEELRSSYPAAAACPDADDIAPASAFELVLRFAKTITLKACISAENFRSTPTALGLYPSTPPHRRVKRTGSVSDVPTSAEAFQSTSAALWSSAFPASSSSVPSSSLAADRAPACPPGQEPPSLPTPSLVMARSKALAPTCDSSDVATTPAAGSGANLIAVANPTEHSPNDTANIPGADIPSATSANGNGIAAPASPAETPTVPSGPSSQTRQPFQPPQISPERMVLDFVASQTAGMIDL